MRTGCVREDIRMLHGGDETVIGEWMERRVTGDESIRLEEDIRAMHGR